MMALFGSIRIFSIFMSLTLLVMLLIQGPASGENWSSVTIRLLPDDINLKSLLDSADVVLTARGTAGLEFSCFGIPCIVTAESAYSGFGFTIEPKTEEEYFKLLSNVGAIGRLNEEQLNRAKVLAYIHFVLLGAETSSLSTDIPYFGAFDKKKVWRRIYEVAGKAEPQSDPFYQKFSEFLDTDASHILSRSEFYSPARARRA